MLGKPRPTDSKGLRGAALGSGPGPAGQRDNFSDLRGAAFRATRPHPPPNKCCHNPRLRDAQPESLYWEDLGSQGTPARSVGESTAQDEPASSRLGNVLMVSRAPCPQP